MADKITKAFVEENIKEPVEKFTVGSGSNKGDNVAGELLAIKATTKSGKVYNLVHKCLADEPGQRGWATEFGIFKTEAAVYSDLLPDIEKVIAKHNKSTTPYVIPVPKFYSGFSDGENDYICLEDVRPKGYRMPDKFEGLNLQETSLIMKNIAEFHAATYFFIKYEGHKVFDKKESVGRMKYNAFSDDSPKSKEMGKKMFNGCIQHAKELINNTNPELGKRVLANPILSDGDRVFELMNKVNGDTEKKHFPCIIHGDFWVNNIMLKYENDDKTKPVDLIMIDFQMTRLSNIFTELNYFMMCSTTPEFRKNHMEQVLKVYYESFCEFLGRVKCPIPIGFTRGYIVDTMYDLMFSGFIYLAFAIPMQLADPIDFTGQIVEAATKLGVDMSLLTPPAPPPENDENSEKQNDPPPPPSPEMMDLHVKLRFCMMYLQLEKSERGVQRLMDVTQEMVDLKIL